MQLERLILYFDSSPAIRLFRSVQNAPYVVDFLFQQFKKNNRITVSHSDLLAALIEYRDSIVETHPNALRDKPEQYLIAWCTGETRWLRRFSEANRNEPIYQLTSHIEDVFGFLESILERDVGSIGTESRLRIVIDMLADLVTGATKDPDVRLKHLNEARAKIDDEISRILVDGVVQTYEPAKVRERFATAMTLLKQLLGDFRAVEDRFKDITRQVQQRHVDGKDARGNILGFALDAEDVLKKDDQGVSFYEFFNFILSPVQQEKVQGVISELTKLEELSTLTDGLTTVRRMVPSLIAEAEKVMRTNQRLSSTLRRLLDTRSASERQRLGHLIGEIKAAASSLANDPPLGTVGLAVDTTVDIQSPVSRTFWSKPTEFTTTDLSEYASDDETRRRMFQAFSQLHRLDWKAMRNTIVEVTKRRVSVSLKELLEEAPADGGVVEILGYIQIARDDRHLINPDKSEEIVMRVPTESQPGVKLIVPWIVFLPPIEGMNVQSQPNHIA